MKPYTIALFLIVLLIASLAYLQYTSGSLALISILSSLGIGIVIVFGVVLILSFFPGLTRKIFGKKRKNK